MEEGTIVHVDYELYNGESGDLIETTREAVAKEHETHQEGRSYSPMVCVVGGGNLIPGFEAALADAKANKEIEVTIQPADAYGEKDPSKSRPSASTSSFEPSRTPTRFTSAHPSTSVIGRATCPTSLPVVLGLTTTTPWLERP